MRKFLKKVLALNLLSFTFIVIGVKEFKGQSSFTII